MTKKNPNKRLSDIFKKINVRALNKAIKDGADVNAFDKNGWTYLMIAADKGDIDCLNALIEAKANVDLPSVSVGHTALMIAAYSGRLDCVKALIPVVENINEMSPRADCAVGFAAENGHDDSVKALLVAGAFIDSIPRLDLREKYAGFAKMVEDRAKNQTKKPKTKHPKK